MHVSEVQWARERPRQGAPGHGRRVSAGLGGEEDADHEAEEADAFDERRGDEHGGPDVAGGRGLTAGGVERGGGETADAEADAEDAEAGADARGEERQYARLVMTFWF